MSAPPYMKLYIADYLGDTHHLTVVEHGAYLLLLMSLWRAGGKLPNDPAKLAKLARCTPEQWAEIAPTVMDFFTIRGAVIVQKRATEEIAKYTAVVRGSKAAGKASGRKRANKNNDVTPNDRSQDVERKSNQLRTQNSELEEKENPLTGVKEIQPVLIPLPAPAPKPAPEKGRRLSPDWRPSEDGVAYATGLGFDARGVERMAERFRNYWVAKAGRDAVKRDWTATWRNWVLREAEQLPQNAGQRRSVGWV